MTLCGPSATIDPDHVAVIWQRFHNSASFCPFSWLARVAQVLNGNCVTMLQGREGPGMGIETLLHARMTLRMSLLTEVCFKSPLLAGLKLPVRGGKKPLHLASEYDHGRAETSERVNSVPVLQQGACKGISVKAASRAQIPPDQALC